MHYIEWPEGYLPGTTDNFVSNEEIVSGLSSADVWPLLEDAGMWSSYYQNASDLDFCDKADTLLAFGAHFRFNTFGFVVEAEVMELVAPQDGKPGRVAWRGVVEGGDADEKLDVWHAWLVEDLPGGRVRILTQETQIGKLAENMAKTRPNPMLNGHQAWLDGLISSARANKLKKAA